MQIANRAVLKGIGVLAWAAALSVSAFQGGFAQGPPPQGSEGDYHLIPEKVPDIENGKASILQGEAGVEGDKFFVEYLNITQPVTIVLIAANPAEPLTLNLSKYRYDESDRLGETGQDGAVSFNFRTQGDLLIHVKPKNQNVGATARYFLIAWIGDDIQPDIAPPVVPFAESEGGRGGRLPWGWILALIAAVGGTALVMRRRRSA